MFAHLLKYILNTYFVLGPVLGSGDRIMRKTYMATVLVALLTAFGGDR